MMMRASRMALLTAAACVLAGCENDAASYQIGGSTDNALTLIREQRWIWQPTSEVQLVVAHAPDCQRRHRLNPTPVNEVRAELFQTGPQAFLLKNGESWYLIDQRSCGVQPVDRPVEASNPIGTFGRQDGKLRFVAAAAPQPAAPQPAAR